MSQDTSYQPKTYRAANGDELHVGSGGAIIVETGGALVSAYTEGAAIAGIPVVYEYALADHATQTVALGTMTYKTRILEVVVTKTSTTAGVNANTIQLKSSTNAISDAMSINGLALGGVVRAAVLDPTYTDIAANGTLTVTQTKAAGDAAVRITVFGVIIP